jgi:hypothetical protein
LIEKVRIGFQRVAAFCGNTSLKRRRTMRTRPISLKRIIVVLLGIAISRGAFAQTPTPEPAPAPVKSATEFCWSETIGRGVGKVPTECSSSQDKDAGLCYAKCPSGYAGVGPVCWQSCPNGFRDDGAFCAKPEAYGRGAGYPWKFGDALNDDGMISRCEAANGRGNCEKDGAIFYPRCKANFHKVGCCICSPDCPSGMADMGVSCTKKTSTRGAGTVPNCESGKDYDLGLCYDPCGKGADGVGAKGVGPMCWSDGPPGWVQCGMGWAIDDAACKRSMTEQVLTVVDATLSTALLIGTVGASAAESSVWRKAAWTAFKEIGKEEIKKAAKKVAVETAVNTAVTTAADVGIHSSGDTIDYLWQVGELEEKGASMTQIEKNHAIAQITLNSITWLDPTGFVGVVAAYTKPICKDIAANKPPSTKPSGALETLMETPQALEMPLQRQVSQKKTDYDALTAEISKTEAASKAAPAIQQPMLQAQLGALRGRQAAAKADLDRVSAAYQKFEALKPKLATVAAPARTPIPRPRRPRITS